MRPINRYLFSGLENAQMWWMNRLLTDYKIPLEYYKFGQWQEAKSIKEIFLLSEYLLKYDHVVGAVLVKMATQTVMDLNVSGKNSDYWTTMLKDTLHLVENTNTLALEFVTYGNGFRSVTTPKKNLLRCKKCGTILDPGSVPFRVQATGREYKIYAKCPKCRRTTEFEIDSLDMSATNDQFQIYRWNPYLMEIDYIESAGVKIYYYRIPKSDVVRIRKGDPDAMKYIPPAIIKAVLQGQSWIRVNRHILAHFQRFGNIGLHFRGWGLPPTTRIFKEHRRVEQLAQASEMIARLYSLPFIILFPQALANIDPARIPIVQWKNAINNGLKQFRSNPASTLVTAPYATGAQIVGPTSSQISVTNELEYGRKSLVPGLGVPADYFLGGGTWTSANANARSVYNSLSNFRKALERFVDFIVDKIATKKGYEKSKISIKWTPMRLVDDIAKWRVLAELAQNHIISYNSLYSEMGLNIEQEKASILDELKNYQEPIQQAISKLGVDINVSQKKEMDEQMQAIQQASSVAPDEAAKLIAIAALNLEPHKRQAYFQSLEQASPEMYDMVQQAAEAMMDQARQNGQKEQLQKDDQMAEENRDAEPLSSLEQQELEAKKRDEVGPAMNQRPPRNRG